MHRIRVLTLAMSVCVMASLLILPSASMIPSMDKTYNFITNGANSNPFLNTTPRQISITATSKIPTGDGGTTYQNGTGDNGSSIWLPFLLDLPNFIGNTLFVDGSRGSDNNPGTLTQPFRTISKGVDKLVAGDTLFIRGGTYPEIITINVSGSFTAPITISAYPNEHVLIDDTSQPATISKWVPAIKIMGNYITVQNLDVTYPQARGLSIEGSYNKIYNLDIHGVLTHAVTIYGQNNLISSSRIHDSVGVGINLLGPNNILESNLVYKVNLSNDLTVYSGANWGGGIVIGDSDPAHAYSGLNSVVRNNAVYDTYGEGILCMYTDNVLIEGNRVWDNWAEDIYLDQCSYTTIRNNLIYYTTDHEYWRFEHPASGIEFSDEGIIPQHPVGHDQMIYNNIIVNTGFGIFFWTGLVPSSALINDTILYNTIVSNFDYGIGIKIGKPNAINQNTLIMDNLIQVLGDTPLALDSDPTTTQGITFTHNMWSKKPSLTGSGDIIGDPLLTNSNQSIDVSIDPYWYTLTSLSPAIGHALNTDVTMDYFWMSRDASPDMGACEFK
jgi:parallel beta-helix repeat protein